LSGGVLSRGKEAKDHAGLRNEYGESEKHYKAIYKVNSIIWLSEDFIIHILFFRDWSEEGAKERESSYQPILDELENLFPKNVYPQRESIHILAPGSGLSRLAFEITRLGFSCEGNEVTYFMLLGSEFILNR
jgi:hypothetical protein